ncbi:Abi family protein [Chitinophaga sp. Hz27]|uniref:Abi family protein n=1 Tax=Chitinophaga sp. Hz27 TaxID=3347169 RepID=UPI0035DCF56E
MPISFEKPITSIDEQLSLLSQRGLIINDTTSAEHYLTFVGYYRLAGYWQFMQDDRINHIFTPNSSFDKIIELYNFDRELRLLLTDAIERVEVSLRAVIVNTMCANHGFAWYSNLSCSEKETLFTENLLTIDNELARSAEDFIIHHNRKYGKDEYPPAWKTMQVLSFGTLSKVYSNIRNNLPEKKLIAKAYGLPTYTWLESWMLVISVMRNYCAHHSRICYRKFNYPPKELIKSMFPWIKKYPTGVLKEQLYFQICVVKYILDRCAPNNRFSKEVKALIEKYPSVSLSRMGFMPGWENEDLWK